MNVEGPEANPTEYPWILF